MHAGTVLSKRTWSFGTVDRAIQHTFQERSQSVPGFEVSGTWRSASLGCVGAAKRESQPGRWGEVGSQGGRAGNETRSSITYPGRTSLAAGRCPKDGLSSVGFRAGDGKQKRSLFLTKILSRNSIHLHHEYIKARQIHLPGLHTADLFARTGGQLSRLISEQSGTRRGTLKNFCHCFQQQNRNCYSAAN